MKKFMSILLALVMVLSLVACGGNKAEEKPAEKPADTKTEAPAEKPAEPEKKLDYPKGAITAICPYAAGGSTDISLRTLLTAWEDTVGTSFVVNNVTGGSGTVAATQMVTEKTDGYVIGQLTLGNMVTSTFSVDVTYDLDSFDFIGAYLLMTFGLLVNPDSQYQTFDEIVEAAKANPIKVVCCGTTEQIAVNKLNASLGTKFEDIYYNSTSDAVTDLIAGRIDALVSSEISMASYLKADQVKLLARLSETRFNNAPDIETIVEKGYPECATNSFHGVGVPKGVDPEILAYLRETFMAAVTTDEFAQSVIEQCNAEAYPMDHQEYYDFLVAQRAEQSEIVPAILAAK